MDNEDRQDLGLNPERLRALVAVMRESGVLYLKTADLELRLEPTQEPVRIPVSAPPSQQELYDKPYFNLK